jgi:hypothetical protein
MRGGATNTPERDEAARGPNASGERRSAVAIVLIMRWAGCLVALLFVATIGCDAAPGHAARATTTTLATPARTTCTASEFLSAARRSFPPGMTGTTVASVRCGGTYMEGAVTCQFVAHPTDGCQPIMMMFNHVNGTWKLVALGAWDCASDPDPAIRAGCLALAHSA